MEEKDVKTTEKQPAGSLGSEVVKYRLFANSEETYKVIRPSIGAFSEIRKLALRSTKISLTRKFDICKELALDWRVELNLDNRKALDQLLEQIETDDPIHLGEKILEAREIRERFNDQSLTPFQLARLSVPHLFRDDAGNVPSVTKESAEDLLIGNVEQALGFFFAQINIGDGEDLTTRTSFKPFTNSTQEYPLNDVSVRTMRELNELQVQTASMSEAERRQICDEMRWNYNEVTPEKITDMKSKPEYWKQASKIVLKGVELTDSNQDDIDAGEMNRALSVFFAKSDGLL